MIDVNTLTLDSRIRIKILTPGIYIPELHTYTPLQTFASIENIISILNRGIKIEFPQQENREISEKIEEILLDYNDRQNKLRAKHGLIGTNIDKALETVQEINDSKLTKREIAADQEGGVFEYSDVMQRVITNLRDTDNNKLFDTAFSDPNVDKLKQAEEERKSRDRMAARRKEALEMAALEAETWKNLTEKGQFNFTEDNSSDIDYIDPDNETKPNVNNPFFRKK